MYCLCPDKRLPKRGSGTFVGPGKCPKNFLMEIQKSHHHEDRLNVLFRCFPAKKLLTGSTYMCLLAWRYKTSLEMNMRHNSIVSALCVWTSSTNTYVGHIHYRRGVLYNQAGLIMSRESIPDCAKLKASQWSHEMSSFSTLKCSHLKYWLHF